MPRIGAKLYTTTEVEWECKQCLCAALIHIHMFIVFYLCHRNNIRKTRFELNVYNIRNLHYLPLISQLYHPLYNRLNPSSFCLYNPLQDIFCFIALLFALLLILQFNCLSHNGIWRWYSVRLYSCGILLLSLQQWPTSSTGGSMPFCCFSSHGNM